MFGGGAKATPQAPAPAPAPAAPSAQVAQAEPQNTDPSNDAIDNARRKGRNALRIPLSMGGAGGGTGLNLPVG